MPPVTSSSGTGKRSPARTGSQAEVDVVKVGAMGDGEGFEADVDRSFRPVGRTIDTEAFSMTEVSERGEAERSVGDNAIGREESKISLSPEQKMKMAVSGLLADAITSIIGAIEKAEPGEIVEVMSNVPESIRNALYAYRPTGPFETIIYDDRKTRIEEACHAMSAYANALIGWVQETRSTTLIPLQRFYRAEKGEKGGAAASKQGSSGAPHFVSDTQALAYIDRVQDLNRKLDVVRARWKGCNRVRQRLDQSWRTHRARTEYEWQARNIVSDRPERDVAKQTLDTLRKLQASHTKQAKNLEWIQRWIDGAQTHPAYAIPILVDDPYPTPSFTVAELAESYVVQQWASELGLWIGGQTIRSCEESTRSVLSAVVDDVEERIRTIMKALDELGPASRNAVDTFTARTASR